MYGKISRFLVKYMVIKYMVYVSVITILFLWHTLSKKFQSDTIISEATSESTEDKA